jgi:hypothetical protein
MVGLAAAFAAIVRAVAFMTCCTKGRTSHQYRWNFALDSSSVIVVRHS